MANIRSEAGARAMESVLNREASEEWQQNVIKTMNNISRPLARNALDKIGLNEGAAEPFRLLDQGCGLGVVAPLLMETIPADVMRRSSVLCGDFSESLVDTVNQRIAKEGWVNTEARVVDAQDSGLPSESFTHVIGNICYHVVPDSEAALKDSVRILRPGGTLALTTWHAENPIWAAYVRDAFASFPRPLLPANYEFRPPLQTTAWGRWHDVDWLREALASHGGLEDVRVEVFAHTWPVESAGEFMRLYGNMIDLLGEASLGEESVGRLGGPQGVRARVREYLEGRFGEAEGWTMTGLSILAWGRKPEE